MIQENVQLQPYNTFGLSSVARYFAAFSAVKELKALLKNDIILSNPKLILGGGSNILLTKPFDGVVLKNEIKGVDVLKEDTDHVWVKAGAGEVWHEFVLKCIDNNWAGVENLSLIPGNVGASPMQNIGAYGVEIKDVFESLEAVEIATGKIVSFDKNECNFGYRESIFKNTHKDQYIITSVLFKLNKIPQFRTDYGAIQTQLKEMGVKELSIKAISDAVIAIRQSKLPDPKEIGNAGSFFKNPVIPFNKFERIICDFPTIPNYPAKEGYTKVAAGWLIEQAGWKGKTFEEKFGVHKKQALVLVNYGGAHGNSIYDLSNQIINSVKEKFGIELEREVNVV